MLHLAERDKEKKKRAVFMEGLMKKRMGAILLSVLPMVIYLFLLVLFILICVLLQGDYPDKIFSLIHAVSMALAAAIMCGVLRKRTGKRLKNVLSVKRFDFTLVLLLLIFTWCAGEVTDGIVAHLCSGFMTVTSNASPTTPLGIAEAILAAPILEEIIFRYLGTEFAEQYFPLPVLCVANAIYFTLMHGYNIQGFVNIMVFAVCMVYVYLKTRRLVYVITVHMLHNAACLLDYGDKLFLGSPVYSEKNGFVLGSPQWIAVNLVVAVVCAVIYLKKYRGKNDGK